MSKKPSAKSPKKNLRETNAAPLRQAMLRRLPRRTTASGEIRIAAVPALCEHYVQMFGTVFGALGRAFNADETAHLRGILETHLKQGWQASPFAKLVIRYQTDPIPKTTLSYTVSLDVSTIADEYAQWVNTRTPPLFGAHPDSKVMLLAQSLGEPATVPVLDIGAGTGRNTIPLAQAGFPTDAVELAPALATILRDDIAKHGLDNVRVFEGDVFDPALEIPEGHYKLLVLAEVVASHFRDVVQLRALFEGSAEMLMPGGLLVFSAFLSADGYKPDALARELSQVFWCCLFTRRDLAEAVEGQPFDRVSDESVAEFEHEHLPSESWPPTGWFTEWTGGQDLFDLAEGKAPLELRWLVYKRR
jgi:SAM-dependent methyltransferase